MEKNYKKLQGILQEADRVAVAFSGGVDSSLLLAVAADVLGDKALALLARSVLMPGSEVEQAERFARQRGYVLQFVDFVPLSLPDFRKNTRQRCYLCKKTMYKCLREAISADVLLIDGTNIDDLDCDRPGLKAVKELGVRMPLVESGFTKVMVRRLSRELALPGWNKFSSSCLATRIPFGRKITGRRLAQVAEAENFLHELGFYGCRVRLGADGAYVSLVSDDNERFVSEEISCRVGKFFTKLDLPKVFLELSARPGIVI